jgi:hypothetical protein
MSAECIATNERLKTEVHHVKVIIRRSRAVMDASLKHPSTFLVAGATGTGKSSWVRQLIKHRLFTPQIELVYAYAEFQESFAHMEGVEFVNDIPSVDMFDKNVNNLLIIDDFQNRVKEMTDLFTKYSHHRNITVVVLLQNPFAPHTRTLSLNAHYFVFMRNPRDKSQIAHLARQIAPGKSDRVLEAFNDATQLPYGYLLIDLRQETPEQLRYRTDIFNTDMQRVYMI